MTQNAEVFLCKRCCQVKHFFTKQKTATKAAVFVSLYMQSLFSIKAQPVMFSSAAFMPAVAKT
jgi:hypothetical protein